MDNSNKSYYSCVKSSVSYSTYTNLGQIQLFWIISSDFPRISIRYFPYLVLSTWNEVIYNLCKHYDRRGQFSLALYNNRIPNVSTIINIVGDQVGGSNTEMTHTDEERGR